MMDDTDPSSIVRRAMFLTSSSVLVFGINRKCTRVSIGQYHLFLRRINLAKRRQHHKINKERHETHNRCCRYCGGTDRYFRSFPKSHSSPRTAAETLKEVFTPSRTKQWSSSIRRRTTHNIVSGKQERLARWVLRCSTAAAIVLETISC